MSLTRHIFSVMTGALVLGAWVSPSLLAQEPGADQARGNQTAEAEYDNLGGVFEEYCTKCHNFEDYAGGIDLQGLGPDNIHQVPEIGEKVIKRLRAGMMPPVGEPRPEHERAMVLASALEDQIDRNSEVSAGRPGLHRLNRTEYENAIRDLLGLEVDAADFLPPDDSSNGFDNQAGTLTLSPAHLEGYLSAAGKISRLAVGESASPTQTLYRVAEDENQSFRIEGLPFGTRGGLKFTHNFPVDGEYTFKTYAITLGNMGNDRPFGSVRGEKVQVLIDGELVKTFDWDEEFNVGVPFGQRDDDEEEETLPTLDVTVPVSAGPHTVGVTFVARNFAPGLDMNNAFERSTIETGGLPGFTFYPHIGSVRVDGPYNASGVSKTPSREKLFTCYPSSQSEEAACAEEIIRNFSYLAFRGNSTEQDVQKLMGFFEEGREQGGTFDSGVTSVVQRVLADPKFIYRIEEEPQDVPAGEEYQISDLDLASRLSFFLWSSLPDRELLDTARNEDLSDPEVLREQINRMLADPKSEEFTENFAGQWLALRNLDSHAPVTMAFPDFDNALRGAMKRETELLFRSLIQENRPVTELLNADYTFVNERLAMHYGIEGVKGERFRRVELDGDLSIRRGIMGKGSTLTVASQPGRTSPVIRGYWTLSSVLGVEPPPPPPNVPALEPEQGDNAGNSEVPTMREQMVAHRINPACVNCHRLMDPIGFALESYNAVGKFRTQDANGNPINSMATLYDGTEVNGPQDIIDFLMKYKESYIRNMTESLMTYALGRGMEYEDMPLVREVMDDAGQDNYRFQSLIRAVVTSKPFLNNVKVGGVSQAEDPEGQENEQASAGESEQAESTVVASATGGQ